MQQDTYDFGLLSRVIGNDELGFSELRLPVRTGRIDVVIQLFEALGLAIPSKKGEYLGMPHWYLTAQSSWSDCFPSFYLYEREDLPGEALFTLLFLVSLEHELEVVAIALCETLKTNGFEVTREATIGIEGDPAVRIQCPDLFVGWDIMLL